jgi:hypothetical protein
MRQGTLTLLSCFASYKILISQLVLVTLIFLSPCVVFAQQEDTPILSTEEGSKTEVIWEFDPYYTNIEVFIPLTQAPVPTINSSSELEIYQTLLENSAIPRYMLLEASVYPLPVVGSYLKQEQYSFYQEWVLGRGGINLLESATAGFQEPWAVSAFFGNIAKLVRPGELQKGSNFGYSGYLLSAGSKHIKDNVLISDNWYELEWKIKGKRDFPNDKLRWSFRVGGKVHENPSISDVIYAAIHRNNLDTNFPFLNWVKNTEFDFKVHFSQSNGKLVRGELLAGKKYPISNKSFTPTLNIGFIWSSQDEYKGELQDRQKSTVTLIFRPSIEF